MFSFIGKMDLGEVRFQDEQMPESLWTLAASIFHCLFHVDAMLLGTMLIDIGFAKSQTAMTANDFYILYQKPLAQWYFPFILRNVDISMFFMLSFRGALILTRAENVLWLTHGVFVPQVLLHLGQEIGVFGGDVRHKMVDIGQVQLRRVERAK